MNFFCIAKDNCVISKNTRNRCRSCRFKKCTREGMSIDGIRMGRIPKIEKLKALNPSASSSNSSTSSLSRLEESDSLLDEDKQLKSVLNIMSDTESTQSNDDAFESTSDSSNDEDFSLFDRLLDESKFFISLNTL